MVDHDQPTEHHPPTGPAARVALGTGAIGLVLLALSGLLNIFTLAVVVGLALAGAYAAVGATDVDVPDYARRPMGGIPFHELWMRRRAKKRDHFRGHGRR